MQRVMVEMIAVAIALSESRIELIERLCSIFEQVPGFEAEAFKLLCSLPIKRAKEDSRQLQFDFMRNY